MGYLYEDWKADRVAPFKWLETDTGNLTTPNNLAPAFTRDNGVYKTQQAGDRNSHFTGPGVGNSCHYTVAGTMKFDNASAEFGVNFYSLWTSLSRKYTLMRKSTGAVHLYCYYSSASGNDMGAVRYPVIDTNVANLTGTWYHYEIRADNDSNKIFVKWWKEGEAKPANAGLVKPFEGYMPVYGLAGVTTHSGSGFRYWGPITVVTNTPEGSAYMAYEQFTEDTIADIAPFTPSNWSPNYGSIRIATGYDTTGFVFNKQYSSLSYKHKPGSQYPVTCNISPYTNLEWRDYEFSGKIVKPTGAVYDSIWVGVDAYSSGKNQYRAKFRNDTMIVQGGGIIPTTVVLASQFDNGDSLYFKVTVLTNDLPIGGVIYKDSVTYLNIEVSINSSSMTSKFTGSATLNHIKEGIPAVYLDLKGKENSATGAIRFDDFNVRKVY